MDDQEEMEEAAEMEVDKILFEITTGALGKAPSKVTDAFPEPRPSGAMAASEERRKKRPWRPCSPILPHSAASGCSARPSGSFVAHLLGVGTLL